MLEVAGIARGTFHVKAELRHAGKEFLGHDAHFEQREMLAEAMVLTEPE